MFTSSIDCGGPPLVADRQETVEIMGEKPLEYQDQRA